MMRTQSSLKSFSMFVVALSVALAMGAIAHADTIMIDSFAAPAPTANFYSFDLGSLPALVGAQPGVVQVLGESTILGGDRDLTVQVAA
ncbi:MAG TPA: hypothetical protein VE890_07645, partial [Thermoguttaceae bacterium]|nr:hypothetical protein [Thermoguttaceae bacterium]